MTTPKPHAKNLRTGRVSLPNHAYLITAVTASRLPVFNAFTAARMAVRCFYDQNVVRRAQTLAFVVMPDHIHWLLQLVGEGNLSEAARAYKAKVSLLLQQRIWQRGFHDHVIRNPEDLDNTRNYIRLNPAKWDDDEYCFTGEGGA